MRRCLVADDHPAVLRTLADSLRENGFEVVTASDGLGAVELAGEHGPDCAIVDYRMPGLAGAELLERLRAVAPTMALVVYTAEVSRSACADASAARAGVVLKEAPLVDVVRALQAALLGQRYVDARLAQFDLAWSPPPPLSHREREVLTLVAEGLEYARIARRLGIGAETARTHLKKACLRLGAATRTQAVAKALRRGLID